MRRKILLLAAASLVCAVVLLPSCRFLSGYAEGTSQTMRSYDSKKPVGFYRLVFEDFHSFSTDTLKRSAVPWKVLAAGMLNLRKAEDPSVELTQAAFSKLLSQRYGFIVPERIANWPEGEPQPKWDRPLGLVHGTVARSIPSVEMEVANTGCSTCHAGVTYDAQGNPTHEAWIGLPSSSINLGRYADDAFPAVKWASDHPKEALESIKAIFPDTTQTELHSLEAYYFPVAKKQLDKLNEAIGPHFTPYSNGAPGLTNGVATIKFYLGAIGADRYRPEQTAWTSIPDFGGLKYRTSILWDGVYSPPGWAHTGELPQLDADAHRNGIAGISSIVTVGTLGCTPQVAETNIPRMRDAIDYIFDEYRPPKFPGTIDAELASKGEALFQKRCESCHGRYEKSADGFTLTSFPNRIVSKDAIRSDTVRADAVGDDPNQYFGPTAMGKHLDAQQQHGYVAPALTGVWATAPYLHNGSVPTLWHLFHPDSRPKKFQVGGHKLDFEKMGIAGELDSDGVYRYPASYRPWSDPDIYDTTAPGKGATGHDGQLRGIDDDGARALIEFLKQL